MNRERGVTLIELMVTVAIVGIFLTLAVPGFNQMMTSNTLSSLNNDFLGSLNYARSEAVKRGVPVTVCPSSNGAGCTGTWSQGWLVFVDENADGTVDGDDTLLRAQGALPSNYTIASTLVDGSGGAVGFFNYARNGTANNTGLVALCHDNDTSKALVVSVTLTRPRSAPDSSISTCSAP